MRLLRPPLVTHEETGGGGNSSVGIDQEDKPGALFDVLDIYTTTVPSTPSAWIGTNGAERQLNKGNDLC